MRLFVSKTDGCVSVDGESYTIDLSSLPNNFHVLQWYDDHGEIEIKEDNPYKLIISSNQQISSIDDYQWILDAWQVEKQNSIIRKETEAANAIGYSGYSGNTP